MSKISRHLFLFNLILLLIACSKELIPHHTQNQQYSIQASQAEDTSLNNFIKPYHDTLDSKLNKVLAYADVALITGRAGNSMAPAQIALGNFMVDACMEIGKHKATALGKPQPDISIFTWGSIRKSIPQGNITLADVYEVMPFENELVVLKLDGAQTRSLLNQLASKYDPIGGATMVLGEPNQILINGNSIEEGKFYYILVSDYLSFGGDNLSILKEAHDRYLCGIKVRDAIIEYLENLKANGQTLKPNYEQRIRN